MKIELSEKSEYLKIELSEAFHYNRFIEFVVALRTENSKNFAPDALMQKLLTQGIQIGESIAKANDHNIKHNPELETVHVRKGIVKKSGIKAMKQKYLVMKISMI